MHSKFSSLACCNREAIEPYHKHESFWNNSLSIPIFSHKVDIYGYGKLHKMKIQHWAIRIAKRNMIHLTAWIYNFILCFNKDFLPSVTCNTLSPAREWPKYINIITSKRNLSSYEFVWSWQTQSINYTVFKHGIQTKLLDIEWNSPLANLFIGINILCLRVDLWHYIWYKQINHNCLIQIQVATNYAIPKYICHIIQ